jgi:hypothetical protein
MTHSGIICQANFSPAKGFGEPTDMNAGRLTFRGKHA